VNQQSAFVLTNGRTGSGERFFCGHLDPVLSWTRDGYRVETRQPFVSPIAAETNTVPAVAVSVGAVQLVRGGHLSGK